VMDSKLPKATGQVRWAHLLSDFRDRPAELLSLVDSDDSFRSAVQEPLETELRKVEHWPSELRKWRVLLVVLIESEIGTIWSSSLRASTREALLTAAGRWGITPEQVRMVSVESDSIYERLKNTSLQIDPSILPQGTSE
jgi:hypothetical protein